MNDNDLKELVTQGLLALKKAGEIGKGAAAEVANDATDPQLKSLLADGSNRAEQWAQKIGRALDEAGGGSQSSDNPIIEAHTEVSKRIRQQAKTPETRDLGIIASGQLVMHYYIAAFGTLGAYNQRLGNTEAANVMQGLLDESKHSDEQMTRLAEKIMGGTTANASGNNATMR